MKKNILSILSACLFFNVGAQSYSLEQSSQAYEELSNGIPINIELWDDEDFIIDFNFDFEIFDLTVTSASLSANGVLTFDNGNPDVNIQFGLFSTDLVDGGFSTVNYETKHIEFETIGEEGFRILKIQWNDAAVWGATEASVDFQLWIYEETGRVEFHAGENTIGNNQVGVGIIKKGSGITLQDGFFLVGDPSDAQTSILIGQKLASSPINGTVYSFERTSIASVNKILVQGIDYSVLNDIIVVFGNSVDYIEVFDLQGRNILKNSFSNQLEISSIKTGLYLLNVKKEGLEYQVKFMK